MPPAVADPALVTITQTVVERFAPERVVLFGSRARGDNHAESDYDLLVVIDTTIERGARAQPIRDALSDAGYHTDVIVYTPAEFERSRHDVGAMAYAGETEGVLLYDRTPARWPKQVREQAQGIPDSLARWLERAENDLAAMTTLARASQSPDPICFHAHEAAEKFLKSALIRNHVAPPRTHKLPEVLGRCADDLSRDTTVTRACAVLEELWPRTRYPADPAPTPADAEAAIAAAHDVRAAVVRHMSAL